MEDARDQPTGADYAYAAAMDNKRQIERMQREKHATISNSAIRQAQRLIRQQAKALPLVEAGYQNYQTDPKALGMEAAAKLIEALIEPEE